MRLSIFVNLYHKITNVEYILYLLNMFNSNINTKYYTYTNKEQTRSKIQYTENQTRIRCLVGVGKTTHTRHYTENVVVGSIHVDSGSGVGTDSVVGDSEEESGVVNTRQVASARRLVLFRVEGEGVDVNTDGRDVGVVLVRLYFVEVATLAYLETIVTVELQESSDDRVTTSHTFNTSDGVTRLKY